MEKFVLSWFIAGFLVVLWGVLRDIKDKSFEWNKSYFLYCLLFISLGYFSAIIFAYIFTSENLTKLINKIVK